MSRPGIGLCVVLCSILLASPCAGAEIDFAWSSCPGEGGVSDVTLPCGQPTQPTTLFCTFGLDETLEQVIAIDFYVSLPGIVGFPAFWSEEGCGPDLTVESFDDVSCVAIEPALPGAQSGAGYSGRVGEGRIQGSVYIDARFPVRLDAGHRYLAFALTFQIPDAVEAGGTCGGCTEPVIFGPPLPGMIPFTTRLLITGLAAEGAETTLASERTIVYDGCFSLNGGTPLCEATPVAPTSWGSLKVIYR